MVEQAVPWGAHGIELRMERGAALSVRVTDAAGTPIPSFAVRLLPLKLNEGNSEYGRVRAQGHFTDGIAAIPSVPVGKWLVWIELPEGSPIASVTAPIEIVDHNPRRVDIRVLEGSRILRVVDPAGVPVAGSRVRVVDPVEGPIEDYFFVGTLIAPLAQFAGSAASNGKSVLACDTTTDGDGHAVLRGPFDRRVTVLIEGPGHLLEVRTDVNLAEAGDLAVTIGRGGSVRGRIVPPAAIVELRRLAGLPPDGPIPAAQLATWARVDMPVAPTKPPVSCPIDAEGTFAIHGITPGDRILFVGSGPIWISAAKIAVREGETIEVALDLTSLLPGTLAGEVTWNGVPKGGASVCLNWQDPSKLQEFPDRGSFVLTTDAHGRFEHRGPPGSYTLILTKPGRIPVQLRPNSNAVVVRDQTTQHVFAIETGRLEVTLLESDGRPVLDRQLSAVNVDPARNAGLQRAEPTGPFGGDVTPGEYDLFVLPSGVALGQHARLPGEYEAYVRRERIKAGHATVVLGQTTALELRMPSQTAR